MRNLFIHCLIFLFLSGSSHGATKESEKNPSVSVSQEDSEEANAKPGFFERNKQKIAVLSVAIAVAVVVYFLLKRREEPRDESAQKKNEEDFKKHFLPKSPNASSKPKSSPTAPSSVAPSKKKVVEKITGKDWSQLSFEKKNDLKIRLLSGAVTRVETDASGLNALAEDPELKNSILLRNANLKKPTDALQSYEIIPTDHSQSMHYHRMVKGEKTQEIKEKILSGEIKLLDAPTSLVQHFAKDSAFKDYVFDTLIYLASTGPSDYVPVRIIKKSAKGVIHKGGKPEDEHISDSDLNALSSGNEIAFEFEQGQGILNVDRTMAKKLRLLPAKVFPQFYDHFFVGYGQPTLTQASQPGNNFAFIKRGKPITSENLLTAFREMRDSNSMEARENFLKLVSEGVLVFKDADLQEETNALISSSSDRIYNPTAGRCGFESIARALQEETGTVDLTSLRNENVPDPTMIELMQAAYADVTFKTAAGGIKRVGDGGVAETYSAMHHVSVKAHGSSPANWVIITGQEIGNLAKHLDRPIIVMNLQDIKNWSGYPKTRTYGFVMYYHKTTFEGAKDPIFLVQENIDRDVVDNNHWKAFLPGR